jgi:hypothetical protein
VETEESRQILKEFAGKSTIGKDSLKRLNLFNPTAQKGYVLHLKRSNIADVVNFLNTDKTRPMFGTDLITVWERRRQWYAECSTHEFIVVKDENEDWNIVEMDLVHFVRNILGGCERGSESLLHGIPRVVGHPSFFLSLTFPDVKMIDRRMADNISTASMPSKILSAIPTSR